MAEYRVCAARYERSVLPLATSIDGHHFSFQAPLEGLGLRVGGYVLLDSATGSRLGQVQSLTAARADAGEIGYDGLSTHVQYQLALGEETVLDVPVHRSTKPLSGRQNRRRCARGCRRARLRARSSRPAS